MNWRKVPFLRLLIPLSVGIIVADCFPLLGISGALGLLIALFLLILVLHHTVKEYRHRWILGWNVMAVFLVVGYLFRCLHEPVVVAERQGWFLARVYDFPIEKEKTVKLTLELSECCSEGTDGALSGKVVAYLEKTDDALALAYGDQMVFFATIDPVPPPQNPKEFDYRLYLRRQGVTGRVYLKQGDWWATGVTKRNPIFYYSGRFRDRLLEVLKQNGITEDEFGAGAAVLLGYDESLTPELRQRYVAAGSMHILCVSGMHVGVVYLMASFLLGFLFKGKNKAGLRNLILLVLIWFYALLTGLLPSILRAALMISMMILGDLVRRKGVLLNSIAASAFILLIINPNNLFSIGFQLSYAAVLGIVLLQRPIYLLVYIENKLLDKVWEITAVSLAAQMATMPFTVYYFNQFAPYFWLSNLLMTPLSFLVILTGMILLLVSWVPFLNLFMGKLVWACLYAMNTSVAWIESFPCSLIKGLYMNRLEFVLALLMLLLWILFVVLKRKRMLLELLVVASVFSGSLAIRADQTARQRQMLFYSLKGHTAIDFIVGQDHLLLCDSALLSEPSVIDYSLKGAWASQQLPINPPCFTLGEEVAVGRVLKRGSLVSFQGILLAFYDRSMAFDTEVETVPVDIMVVSGKKKSDLDRAIHFYRPSLLIVDASVPRYLAEGWKREAESLKIPCIGLDEGCYRYKLP